MPRKRLALNVATFHQNFVNLYHAATADEVQAGRKWYDVARATIAQWAAWAERPVSNIAAMVATLSPQCLWPANLVIAEELLLHGEAISYGALPVNVAKAQRVLAEGLTDTRVVMPTGNKVENFARNLAGDCDAVTVDSHITQAAYNDPVRTAFPKTAEYNAIALAIRLAADETGESPAALQAVVWVVWKRLHASGVKRWQRKRHALKQAQLVKRRAAYARRKTTTDSAAITA